MVDNKRNILAVNQSLSINDKISAMTPMQKQYQEIKEQYPNDIVLFRLGDFYEAFEDDAKTLNKVIGLTLTGRGKGENRIPMAGIPHHALGNYLPDIIKAGYKVAMVDQLSDPEPGKLVERGVTKVYTAGTLTDESNLSDDTNNYLCCVVEQKGRFGVTFADISTADIQLFETDSLPTLKQELQRFNPAEVILSETDRNNSTELAKTISKITMNITVRSALDFDLTQSSERILEQLGTKNLKGFGVEQLRIAQTALGALLIYLDDTQRTELNHIKAVREYHFADYMQLDWQTIRNLELVYPLNGENPKATVYAVLNKTSTSMGKRKLRNWLLRPLLSSDKIQARYDAVAELKQDALQLNSIRAELDQIADIERILGRVGVGNANARELVALSDGLSQLDKIAELWADNQPSSQRLLHLVGSLDQNEVVKNVVQLIKNTIADNPPIQITEGGIIAPGVNEKIDELRELATGGKQKLAAIQARESERTKIPSLKIGYNKVFGYYLEITKTHADKVPSDYIRKQTLTNAERYITPELKELEEKILNAQTELVQLEYDEFLQIRNEIAKVASELLTITDQVAEIDVIANFAFIAREYDYCQPILTRAKTSDNDLRITNGRHLVVERLQESFTANDIYFDSKGLLKILTGPNMSGKSTYIRQVALIALIAQIGCFVPAAEYEFSIVDRIFTRVGAADNLSSGESTFMVEMSEAANILHNATSQSLIIFDEVGRGTSTYDGVAIAWSIAEYVLQEIKAKTLFATHYHELIALADNSDQAENLHVEVIEQDGKVLFKHKISSGATSRSYGVHVAQMAGIPKPVVDRANEILISFEGDKEATEKTPSQEVKPKTVKPSPMRPSKIHPEQLGLLG